MNFSSNNNGNGNSGSSLTAPHRKNAAQRTERSTSPYQQRTSQRDNPTQLIIKQAVDFLIQQLEAGKSETLTAYLGAMARFHNYSFGNILAIARQRPTATRVAGIRAWNELGRFVKRGEKGIKVPPCFIIVCNNTSTSKLVYDYISGFFRPNEDGSTQLENGRLELFRNFDQHGNPYPWERWAVFLHPAQRQMVQKNFSGPAKVSGTAGTGKTIVALHRAAHLARTHRESRLLLTTFSETLANALRAKLRLLLHNEPRLGEHIEVHSMDSIARRLYELNIGKTQIASTSVVDDLLKQASAKVGGHNFSQRFLTTEWEQIVDGWQLDTWEAYRDVVRLGRRARLKESQRKILWEIFESVRSGLKAQSLITNSGLFSILADHYRNGAASPFDFAVVDEAQDISIAQIRFLAAIGDTRPNALFFAGDLGQRIFQQPFSWKTAGVDIRGRSATLKVNYRTSHQIRSQSDRLLGPELADVDGNTESRKGTVSLFNGPQPCIKVHATVEMEIQEASQWLTRLIETGVPPHEIAIFVRSVAEIDRPKAAVKYAGLPFNVLDENVETTLGHVSISTMHLAKGLEFRAVAVMGCDDEVIPLQERIETVADEADLEDVYNTERHLLYVACTRARDHLLVTSTAPASEFLDDLSR